MLTKSDLGLCLIDHFRCKPNDKIISDHIKRQSLSVHILKFSFLIFQRLRLIFAPPAINSAHFWGRYFSRFQSRQFLLSEYLSEENGFSGKFLSIFPQIYQQAKASPFWAARPPEKQASSFNLCKTVILDRKVIYLKLYLKKNPAFWKTNSFSYKQSFSHVACHVQTFMKDHCFNTGWVFRFEVVCYTFFLLRLRRILWKVVLGIELLTSVPWLLKLVNKRWSNIRSLLLVEKEVCSHIL